ncbi:methylated-DNA--[protein]-cysteine S-methyltransferase [Oceanobacillus sp. M65]|uniref:methylated-DNA--[protein]-cysteine S-methyltransferase n=1 Tax=Oceanobacillus sp. M65 TaxID=3457435 RepID=UPI003FCD3946
MNKVDYKSPIGVIEITGTEEAIYEVSYTEKQQVEYAYSDSLPQTVKDCYKQLDEYFNEERLEFNLPFKLEGTPFQQEVWQALRQIPYGETGSYRDIAISIKRDKAVRAVGSANSKNKISIIFPCHRIIGTSGKLTGYAGGLWRKEWLLEHEKRIINK